VVYGVNPAGGESHGRFARKLPLPFGLIQDRGGRVARMYKAGLWLLVRRTVYVIGPEGRIAAGWRGAPKLEEILAVMGY
jgi:peroxiredoxin Q/BCP